MSCSAAALASVETNSFMTANLRTAAQRVWSFWFLVVRSSALRGYALSSNVDSESITMRLVFGGGKEDGGRANRASKCASVGDVQ